MSDIKFEFEKEWTNKIMFTFNRFNFIRRNFIKIFKYFDINNKKRCNKEEFFSNN